MEKEDKTKGEEPLEEVRKIRMTLTSRLVKPLEEACSQVIARSKHSNFKTKGPNRMPTKCLTVTTRRSPCGNGTNTWDRFEMRVQVNLVVWDDDRQQAE